jgi:hypothetical protein
MDEGSKLQNENASCIDANFKCIHTHIHIHIHMYYAYTQFMQLLLGNDILQEPHVHYVFVPKSQSPLLSLS